MDRLKPVTRDGDKLTGAINTLSLKAKATVAKATKPDDPVFTNHRGISSRSLYYGLIERLLEEAHLTYSSAGKRRSTYCFRHTYATFRLSEGVDNLLLASQMGTSVQMIQDHYGHVTPIKNADRILLGMPGWMSAVEMAGEVLAGVNSRALSKDKPDAP